MRGAKTVAKALVVGEMACRGTAGIVASLPGRFKVFCKEVGEHRDTILKPGKAATEWLLDAALTEEPLDEEELNQMAERIIKEIGASDPNESNDKTAEKKESGPPIPCPGCGRLVPEYLLSYGTGKYASELVCGQCETENYAEQLEEADLSLEEGGANRDAEEYPTPAEWDRTEELESVSRWDRNKVIEGAAGHTRGTVVTQ